MSIQIHNAYRLKSSKSKDIETVNEKIRSLINKYQSKQIHIEAADTFVDYQLTYLAFKDESKQTKEKTLSNYLNYYLHMSDEKELNFLVSTLESRFGSRKDFVSIYGNMLDLIIKYDLSIKINPTVWVYFKTVGNYTYYMLWTRNSEIPNKFFADIDKISDKLESYNYWDNTDRPDDIGAAAWNRRGFIWNKIFDKCSKYSDCMNTIQMAPVLYRQFKMENIINELPDDFELLKKFYNEQNIDIISKSEMKKEIQEQGSCSDMRAIRLGEKKIRENIENGTFLTFKDKLFSRGYDRESLIKKLMVEPVKLIPCTKESD